MIADPVERARVIKIGGYRFEGPLDTPRELRDRPGIYAILDVRGSDCRIVDVGESPDVRSRVMNHDRRKCWAQSAKGTLKVAVHYTHSTPIQWRRKIKDDLSDLFVPPCRGEE
jgi:hypothetical protein